MPPTNLTPERKLLAGLKALKASFDSQPNVSMWDHEGWLRKKKSYESSLIHAADALFAELERAWASEAALREENERLRGEAAEARKKTVAVFLEDWAKAINDEPAPSELWRAVAPIFVSQIMLRAAEIRRADAAKERG